MISTTARKLAIGSIAVLFLAALALIGAPPAANAAPPSAPAAPHQKQHREIGAATVVVVHGKIVAVDRAKKLVTFEGPRGKQVTLHVYNPYNLAAAKPGEPFVARFYEAVTFRKKKPGESLPAAAVQQGIVTASPGQTPGAVLSTHRQFVVEIDAINKHKKTVTVKTPSGEVKTLKVANPANLERVKVGDQIVVTTTRLVAISLAKEHAAK